MRFLILLAIMATILLLFTGDCSNKPICISKVIRVIDGDTFIISSNERIRLATINAPELGTDRATESKNQLADLVENKYILLYKTEKNKDKYGRLIREAVINFKSVSTIMVENNFAKQWN